MIERESQIVLGLDPDPSRLWPEYLAGAADDVGGGGGGDAAELAADAILAHCRALIEAVADACVAVKLQLARFEVLGAAGWTVLTALATDAHERGLLVIADGKRGDIDVSAHAYASALGTGLATPFGRVPGLGADLVTVNPLLGRDALQPFVGEARRSGAGVLVLVRTSNPGAADIEDLSLREGGHVWERLASLVADLGADDVGDSGLSGVGAVVGATAPQHLPRARDLMPSAFFLLPGVGAQGGRVEHLSAAFLPGRAAGLVTASRSIADAHLKDGGTPAAAARVQAQRLRETAWTLSASALA